MPACATQQKIVEATPVSNLFLPLPDTDFRDYLDEVLALVRFAPDILVAVEADLDAHARKKKELRLADRRFLESQTAALPFMSVEEVEFDCDGLSLDLGRPRMPAESVYVFLMLRGFMGSLSTKASRRFLHESMSLFGFLQERGLQMPGLSTILENVNAVSHRTRELIFDRQIAMIRGDDLDDFDEQTLDSTAVAANSRWPTDARMLQGLLQRVDRMGQKLDRFGAENFRQGWTTRRLAQIDKLEFHICMVAGKPKSKGKLKKAYRRLLRLGQKTLDGLQAEFHRVQPARILERLAPSRRALLERMLDQMRADLSDAQRVIDYSSDRVFLGKKLSSTEQILSLSDGAAAYIKKGGNHPVIGYKPQLLRSKNGFVTSLLVPKGNAADSSQLVPAIRDAIQRTGVIPKLVSTDDGYASSQGRNDLLGMGIADISISGAKGKRLTDPTDWESDLYRDARRCRSAVESLIFTIKDGFAFGELGRRGIDAVRDELLEKVLAYNCCRSILMKGRRREQVRQVA